MWLSMQANCGTSSTRLWAYGIAKRPPLVERIFDREKVRGRVLLFTSAMDGRPGCNNYLETVTSFYPVLAQTAVRYLAGDTEEASLNYLYGQSVTVALPATPRFPS